MADDSARPALEVTIPTRELDAVMKALREAADQIEADAERIKKLEDMIRHWRYQTRKQREILEASADFLEKATTVMVGDDH